MCWRACVDLCSSTCWNSPSSESSILETYRNFQRTKQQIDTVCWTQALSSALLAFAAGAPEHGAWLGDALAATGALGAHSHAASHEEKRRVVPLLSDDRTGRDSRGAERFHSREYITLAKKRE